MILNPKVYAFTLPIALFFLINPVSADSIQYNSYNNHGVVGLINMPTARSFNDAVHGITLFHGEPDQKLTFTSNPYEWLEASVFYMNIEEIQQCRTNPVGQVFCQGYKDKGFNLKLRLKEEGLMPAIAIGINDAAGTGFYSSEYIVSSYGLNNIDFHFGLGWDSLNDEKHAIKNPLGYIHESFNNRPSSSEGLGQGGQFQASRYFSGKTVSPFYGISYVFNEKVLFKFERDTTLTPGKVNYKSATSDYSFGFEYFFNENLNLGISFEKGNYFSFRFQYRNDPKLSSPVNQYEYKNAQRNRKDSSYDRLRKNLENNGIGVNKIVETSSSIGLDLTQFAHPNLQLIEEIIYQASADAGIQKDIKTDLRIVDLKAVNEIDENFEDSKVIYERNE